MLVTKHNFEQALSEIDQCGARALYCDVETSGLEVYKEDRVIGFAIEAAGKPYYFTFGHLDSYVVRENKKTGRISYLPSEEAEEDEEVFYVPNLDDHDFRRLVDLIYDKRFVTLWWNASFDLAAVRATYDRLPEEIARDVMLMAHLADENSTEVREKVALKRGSKLSPRPSFKLKEQGLLVDDNAMDAEAELKKHVKKGNMAAVPATVVAEYAEQDVILTRALYHHYLPRLKEDETVGLWNRVCHYMTALHRMSWRGIRIDPVRCQEYAIEAQEAVEEITQEIRNLVGIEDFNPNSPAQIAAYIEYPLTGAEILELFVERGWNMKEVYVRGEDGEILTDPITKEPVKRVQRYRLNKTQRELCRLVLEYRGHSKMLKTYYGPYLEKCDANNVLHAGFRLQGTISGRLSSHDPNLQQVPRGDTSKVKDVFLARDGYALVECDYRQAELRVGAHIVKEKEMLATLRDGRDIHGETAEQLGISRTAAKRVGFGIIYGLGAPGLAAQLKVSIAKGKKFLDAYHKLRPGFKRYYEGFQRWAERHGKICMWTGRLRHYDTWSQKHKAISHMIQGSTAEVMRVALTELDRVILDDGVHMLLSVHDSILFEVPLDEDGRPRADLLAKIKNIMEFRTWSPKADGVEWEKPLVPFPGDDKFFVPMRIDMKWGFRWSELDHELEDEDWTYAPDNSVSLESAVSDPAAHRGREVVS